MSEGCVYALMDPRTDTPRYVGATVSPRQRLSVHLSQPSNKQLKEWIDELDEEGFTPEMALLQWADKDDLRREEQKVLDRLFEEHDLLNVHAESYYTHSTESRSSDLPLEQQEHTLTLVDHEVLGVLREGRGTKGYIIDRTGRSRNQVGNRLKLLGAHGYIEIVHSPTALYELVNDPRR